MWFERAGAGLLGGGGLAGEELGEVVLHAEAAFAFLAFDALGASVGLDEVGVLVVLETAFKDAEEEFFG